MIKDTRGQDVVVDTPQTIWQRKTIFGLGIGVLIAGLAYGAMTQAKTQLSVAKQDLDIARVELGALTREVSANGKIVAAHAPTVYSPEVGVATLHVKAGDQVKVGQLIVALSSPELSNELKQQQSELNRLEGEWQRQKLESRRQELGLTKSLDLASVALQAAERENRRAQISIKASLISQIDLEQAEDEYARAKLNYAHAQQEADLGRDTLKFELSSAKNRYERQKLVVDEIQRRVSNLEIRASVEGIVGNLLVQNKAAVSQNEALMRLVDLSAYEVELQVPESYANELGIAMRVVMRVGAQELFGELSAISPEVNNREVTTRVKFKSQDITGIRQNQRVLARIQLENKENVLKVKRGPFLNVGGHFVYLLRDDIAQRVSIEVGSSSLKDIEIKAGLQEGDEIIVSGYDAFTQADSVLIRQ
ncbi:efflux transporter periplasmic adaptor subunit [Pseudoalteromonas luteoviolacea]|uniref:Efflux transporter periplasmic adaptor subunit n=1 Tax=Pseudoalteromonas luteoviolacea TaxID=43657 RepID=A0A1C0TTQ6_9GAMM|nr:HlyD family efflux transporter periplasmic adaptor subunit [Pseudoalteromonas luteoviolacea]MBQ4811228.1 HlyD family efflux transporter periplasmic adaptor subunit [Pseudoalteromonas luteoviolacea]OCQ22708.1 efflux transporter periplasmic adaptor subunit [Pseudoalteromonas luteoviolacea]